MAPTSPDALAPTAPAEPNDRGPGFFYEVPVIGRAKDHRVVLGGPPRVPDWQEGKWKPKLLPERPPPEDYGDVDVAELIRDLDEDARLQDFMPVCDPGRCIECSRASESSVAILPRPSVRRRSLPAR